MEGGSLKRRNGLTRRGREHKVFLRSSADFFYLGSFEIVREKAEVEGARADGGGSGKERKGGRLRSRLPMLTWLPVPAGSFVFFLVRLLLSLTVLGFLGCTDLAFVCERVSSPRLTLPTVVSVHSRYLDFSARVQASLLNRACVSPAPLLFFFYPILPDVCASH